MDHDKNKKLLIEHLKAEGYSEKVISAFEKVKREEFVQEEYKEFAYQDAALPIKKDSTISQPSTIAFMLDLLEIEDGQKVLEIGSGCGYVLALIGEINKKGKIFGIEIDRDLVTQARERLKNYANVKIIAGSGYYGLPSYAPYDRILVSASAPTLSVAKNMTKQLKEDGIIVVPVERIMYKIIKRKTGLEEIACGNFIFVPLKNY